MVPLIPRRRARIAIFAAASLELQNRCKICCDGPEGALAPFLRMNLKVGGNVAIGRIRCRVCEQILLHGKWNQNLRSDS